MVAIAAIMVAILAAIFNMVAKNIKNFEVLQLQTKLIFRVF
jgi:Na+-translocating ferredoxin:NAD+ oxidoreductase RnfG subunit